MISRRVQFDGFELNPLAHLLRKNGRPVPAQHLPLEILELLIQRHGELVTRDEIIKKFWNAAEIGVNARLNTAIHKLRTALQDDEQQPKFIESVGARGYRFIHSYQWVSPRPHPVPEKTVFVHPIKCLNKNPEDESIAAMICEGCVVDLLRNGFQVRYSAGTDPVALGTPAGPSGLVFHLSGSICRSGERLRMHAMLAESIKGDCLWADSLTVSVVDPLLVEDQAVHLVTKAVFSVLADSENYAVEGVGRSRSVQVTEAELAADD